VVWQEHYHPCQRQATKEKLVTSPLFSQRVSFAHSEAIFIHVKMNMEKGRHILLKWARGRRSVNSRKERKDDNEKGCWTEI